ncbi:MAG: cytochrome c biogenesis protein CcsA, partial [Gammaproteobacteria bacterium]|nr:cytochrome c biogenesis protein CcsA [Gammaproteobacteria bacterium]
MSLFIIGSLAIVLYLIASVWLGYRLITVQSSTPRVELKLLLLCVPALFFHAFVLYQSIFTELGMDMGFYNAMSLISWVITCIVIFTTFIKPTINLALIILPISSLTLILAFIMPSQRIVSESGNLGLDIHIIFSIAAYSLLSIASLQAIILAIQDHFLRIKHPVTTMRMFPPMQIMEDLLVQLLWIGFFLLSLALATGLMFVHDVFAQDLSHKTVLTILAWLFYGYVLIGRWSRGWRGKILVRWTLIGFI